MVYARSAESSAMTLWRILGAALGLLLLLLYAGGANYWNKDYGWYKSLKAPSWQPPDFIFGIIWPYNFIVLGIALYLIIAKASWQVSALTILLFAASVFFALRWSYLFYASHDFVAAATALLVTAILTLLLLAITFSHSWKAGLALVPYQIWIFTAAALAHSYADLNKSLT